MKNSSNAIYSKAVEYMKQNITKKLRVTEIAAYCGCSASWLEKTFARVEQKGLMRHFLDLKLEHATELLMQGVSVGELAKKYNFSSIAHLSMAFKKKYGVSPLRYKYPSNTEPYGK